MSTDAQVLSAGDSASALGEVLLRENGIGRFEDLWTLEAPWVEPINRRRGGWSGVVRLEWRDGAGKPIAVYVKRQENHTYRSWSTRGRRRPTLRREFENLQALTQEGFRVTEPLVYATRKEGRQVRAVMITRELEGFESLRVAVYRGVGGEDLGPLKARVVPMVARLAGKLHAKGWAHQAFYPKHLFIRPGDRGAAGCGEVAMVDLEKPRKVRRVGLRERAGDLGPLYRRCAAVLTQRDVHRFLWVYAPGREGKALRRALLRSIKRDGRLGSREGGRSRRG